MSCQESESGPEELLVIDEVNRRVPLGLALAESMHDIHRAQECQGVLVKLSRIGSKK
jgi:hypothetical protein